MGALKAIGSGIKNFMILFSFIVNLVLIIVVVVLLLLIFDIKNNVVSPLITGLHSSFVGLDEATIDWTIPVRDTIPVVLNVPLETETVVVLTESVPLLVNATITLPGVGVLNNASVNLSLPAGLQLPVRLDLDVPINEELDVALDVRAVIPIAETQLHDPINNLRLTFEPITRALFNLPDNFAEAGQFTVDLLSGRSVNLMADTPYSLDPWVGFSKTAGLGYTLADVPVPLANQPMPTGIVPLGGIPALDELVRPELYEGDLSPQTINEQAMQNLQSFAVPPEYYDGSFAEAAQAR
ncbi:MAG: hypothetical protein IAE80_05080 [Anaerolinea sp.]|nr:hypothetical protein [Anaerolinea sp.]